MRRAGSLSRVELEIAYRLAAKRLRQVAEGAVAARFEHRAGELARCAGSPAGRSIPQAIRHAVDAGGARIAARLDPERACLWTAIADDQSRLAKCRLDTTTRS